MRKWIIRVTMATSAILLLMWLIGVWTTDSPRYWRTVAQQALLAGAERANGQIAVWLTHLGMRTHRSGLTTEELARAAGIFERNDRGAQAAMLWLGLAQDRITARRPTEAIDAARRAHRAFPTQETTTTLVLLHWNDAKRDEWVNELARYDPAHEIILTLVCLSDIASLDTNLPLVCTKPAWVAEHAMQAQRAYRKHVKELENLPETAAREVLKTEMELAERRDRLSSYGLRSNALAREHAAEKAKRIFVGIGKVFTPELPTANDTPGSYGARFWFCQTIGKALCALGDIGEEAQKYEEYDRQWREENRILNDAADSTSQMIEINRDDIREWMSTEPFEDLVATRNAVLPGLRDAVQSQLYERRLPIGLPSQPMLDALLGAGPDGQAFRQLGARLPPSVARQPAPRGTLWRKLASLQDRSAAPQPAVAVVHGSPVNAGEYAKLLASAIGDERGAVYRMGLCLRDPGYRGVRVTTVLPDSSAGAAGIQVSDTIHEVNGVRVGSWNQLTSEVRRHCGERLDLLFYRPADDAHYRLSIPTKSPFPCLGIQGSDDVIDRSYIEVSGFVFPGPQQAGVENGDLILTVDGSRPRTATESQYAVQKYGLEHGTASPIPVTIRRRGKTVELQLPVFRVRREP
jgi:hypothetical protein